MSLSLSNVPIVVCKIEKIQKNILNNIIAIFSRITEVVTMLHTGPIPVPEMFLVVSLHPNREPLFVFQFPEEVEIPGLRTQRVRFLSLKRHPALP